MRVSEADLLFVPGLGGSGSDHWQTRWAEKLSTAKAIDLPGLDAPDHHAWTSTIATAIAKCERPVVLVGHSLGSLAIIHATRTLGHAGAANIRAAFLVAPPAARTIADLTNIDPKFAAVSSDPLPFPSLLIASRNDPYATMAESETMALDWGSQIVDAGDSGHINADSGHGPWPEGLMRFATFMARI